MFASDNRAFARKALLFLAILPVSGPVLAEGPLSVSAPHCRGALCYVLVSDDTGNGVLVRARGLLRARTLALEVRDDLIAGRVAGRPAACAPVPELCPAG